MKFLAFLTYLLASAALAAPPSTYPVLVESSPFTGSLFYRSGGNEGRDKHTSVVMLHGSEGGSAFLLDAEASVLATQGYNVLLLCYFDCNRGPTGPRQILKNVEATVVLGAVAWLRARKDSNGVVAVYGFSRGAELALVAGSLPATPENKPNALIAHSPSDTFNGPMSWDWLEAACWLCRRGQGMCPPGTPDTEFEWNLRCGEENNPALVDFSASAWLVNGKTIPTGERIPVEKFSGPVLLTVGLKDEMWPAAQTKNIENTLRAAGTNVQARYFPEGGHMLHGSDELERRELVLDFLNRL